MGSMAVAVTRLRPKDAAETGAGQIRIKLVTFLSTGLGRRLGNADHTAS